MHFQGQIPHFTEHSALHISHFSSVTVSLHRSLWASSQKRTRSWFLSAHRCHWPLRSCPSSQIMDYPVILARQTPHGMVAEAGQGKGKEGIRMEQNRVDLCLHRVRLSTFTQLLKREWKLLCWISSSLQLPICIWNSAFPKFGRQGTKQKTDTSIQDLLHSWEQVKCRNQGESSSWWELALCLVVVMVSLR